MSSFLYRLRRGRCSIRVALAKSTRFLLAFVNSARSSKKLDHLPQNLEVFTDFFERQFRCKREGKATLFPVETISSNFNSLAAPFARRPKVEGGKSSQPKYIKSVHLVFCESFNKRHNKYSDRFLLEKGGDRSLALLDTSKIFYSQLVTKRRHRYLRKTNLELFAVLLLLSPKVAQTCLRPWSQIAVV